MKPAGRPPTGCGSVVEDPGSLRELIDELHHKAALFLVQNLDIIIILLSVWTEGLLFI